MARWKIIIARLYSFLANRRVEDDLAREVASHLTLLADDFERRGMTPEEARFAARRALGGVEQGEAGSSQRTLNSVVGTMGAGAPL